MSELDLEFLQLEIDRLKHAYEDLKSEITLLSKDSNGGSLTRKRGALASAGVTCEAILKFIYKKEGMDKGARPAESMMLEDLLQKLNVILPAHIQINLRTIQAWRNMGAHDKGDFREIDESTINMVDAALKAIVLWFFNSYLDQQFNFSEAIIEQNSEGWSLGITDEEIAALDDADDEVEASSNEENADPQFDEFYADDFNLEDYFGNVNSKLKIKNQIDPNKVRNFIDNIDDENIVWENFASDEFWVYYDKTFWQNGKEGFLICSDANYIYLVIKDDQNHIIYSFAIDDITQDYIYITDLDIVDNNIELTLLNEDEKHYWVFSAEINQALLEFFQEEIEPRKTY
jgi:hypothetical protein